MTYIHFTEEQKYRASCVDLVEFLRRQGEKLIRSGPEYRMASDHSVTVRGNEWYDHAAKEGGGPISFVQNYCGLSYPEAVTRLLEGEQGQIYEPAPRKREEPKKEFIQPPVSREMRRVYAYLLKKRLIDREVLSTFVWAGLIYEDEKYHNAVFAGKDEHGVVRHAHKRSTSDIGKTFRINVEGSDPRYSFHWNGTSDRLYVFEAPIDLLSFLTLYPKDWQRHSYVALCGVGEQAMLWMLEQAPEFRRPILCLDHDAAGIEATGRLKEILAERGYAETAVLQSIHIHGPVPSSVDSAVPYSNEKSVGNPPIGPAGSTISRLTNVRSRRSRNLNLNVPSSACITSCGITECQSSPNCSQTSRQPKTGNCSGAWTSWN